MAWTEAYLELSDEMKEFSSGQYQQAYGLIDAARYPSGLYADAYHTLEGQPGQMGSIAATGVGLIGLAIAHMEGWDPGALAKLRHTLELVATSQAGPGGPVARDPASGFFYHFYDKDTGAAWPGSEVSTIDTAILVAGALFAARLLGRIDPTLTALALKLLHSIDWKLSATADGQAVNMCIEDGRGTKPNDPFSEYAIVAWLAHQVCPESEPVSTLWSQVYRPDQVHRLRHLEYQGLRLFGQIGRDGKPYYLSSFVTQFPLYLIPDYAESAAYHTILADHCTADRRSWQAMDGVPDYIWGHGAGSNSGLPAGRDGYQVDNVARSSGVASAYIVAGFLPVYPQGIYDMFELYRRHLAAHGNDAGRSAANIPRLQTAYRFGLGRFSWSDWERGSPWLPRRVTVIDWSTMLYGLAAFHRGLELFGSSPVDPTQTAMSEGA